MERIQKILCNRGICSRRKAEELIKQGKIRLNDRIAKIGDSATEKDKITIEGKKIKVVKKIYLAFHKPVGCVTALTDKHKKTIMQYIKINDRVFPVGRLDEDTSGLLLLTNDGDFSNKVLHPRNEITKTYRVELNKPIFWQKIEWLETGVKLSDGKTSPAKVEIIRPHIINLTIHEGKNRIVRRMIEKIGLEVVSLKRVKIGELGLLRLKLGEYTELNEKQKEKIFQSQSISSSSRV